MQLGPRREALLQAANRSSAEIYVTTGRCYAAAIYSRNSLTSPGPPSPNTGPSAPAGVCPMIVTTKDLFEQAYGKYAVGAYNINNLEQTIGLFRGNLGKKDKNEDKVANNT